MIPGNYNLKIAFAGITIMALALAGCGGGGGAVIDNGSGVRFSQPAAPMIPANMNVGPSNTITVPDDQPTPATAAPVVTEMYSAALAINNSGQASGDFHTSDGSNRAFITSSGAFND